MPSAPYLGPEPTIAQLRAQFSWIWACCGIDCAHYAALPLASITARLGADAPASALRRRLRCTQCGRRSAVLSAPSARSDGLAPLPLDRVPVQLRREMAREGLRGIGVEPIWLDRSVI